ncbi:cyclin-dependent kinase inhibitor 1D isoform X1 [Simochromis diagramma]|uniref:cyclin-dependent kinase inhibitor 1D isoform X1 n=2 Tax=Simochromis diagramma TaxID=43689 RepID=UPI001A7EF91A|nr:cyclin-dependent kinase inhibitor 1D isoform X1 [Simochromis diagramma]
MAATAKIFDLLLSAEREKRNTARGERRGNRFGKRAARNFTFSQTYQRDMAMASKSIAEPAMESDPELLRLGGIEAWKLKAGPVRKNLFGPVDHQQLQQDFQRLLCMSVEVANKRWNFDFQSDVPLEGSNIQWEALRCQDVPAFYRSCTVRPLARSGAEKTKERRRTSSLSGEGSPGSSASSGSGDEYLEVTTRGCYRIQRTGKRRQAAITDFFKVKKRRLLHNKASSRQ